MLQIIQIVTGQLILKQITKCGVCTYIIYVQAFHCLIYRDWLLRRFFLVK
jgi:hypothetical protein